MFKRISIAFVCVAALLAGCATQAPLDSGASLGPGRCAAGVPCTIDVADGCSGASACAGGFPNTIEVTPPTGTTVVSTTPITWKLPGSGPRLVFAAKCIEFDDPPVVAGQIACVASGSPAKSCTCQIPATPKGPLHYKAYLVVDPFVVNR